MKKTFLLSIVSLGLAGVTFAMTPSFSSDVLPWMNTNGLTKFTTSADFRANDAIVRGEAAKFVASFGHLRKLPKIITICLFSDVGNYDTTLVSYIATSCELGLLKGTGGKFLPNDALTEAQALAIVIRALEGFKDETMSPWYKSYFLRAQELGLITSETQASVNTTKVIRGKLGTWFYLAQNGSMKKDDMMKDDMMKDNMKKDDTMMMKAGNYSAYSELALKAALAEDKKVVLFFHASRCPACVNADKEITATTVPDNSVIFKVNYDTETALKQKYGVTSQHTFVFLDATMEATSKKVGTKTSDILELLK